MTVIELEYFSDSIQPVSQITLENTISNCPKVKSLSEIQILRRVSRHMQSQFRRKAEEKYLRKCVYSSFFNSVF